MNIPLLIAQWFAFLWAMAVVFVGMRALFPDFMPTKKKALNEESFDVSLERLERLATLAENMQAAKELGWIK